MVRVGSRLSALRLKKGRLRQARIRVLVEREATKRNRGTLKASRAVRSGRSRAERFPKNSLKKG